MRSRSLISFVILTMLVGLGFLMLSTEQARATENGDPCTITIEKEADPADNTEFDFSVTGGQNFDFTLMDPSDATEIIIINSEDVMETAVTEEVPSGWKLDKIECTEAEFIMTTNITNGIMFKCDDSDEITCTFFNVKLPINIPTLSEYGLIAMAGILGIVGFMVIRRRRAVA